MPAIERRPSTDALHPLPGQAVHLGHSCVLLNVGGVRILLDPATVTGSAVAPFANLTATGRTRLDSYRPLFDLTQIVPSTRDLAQAADVVIYSHLHADHFNASLLGELLTANPALRVVLPQGALTLLRAPRSTAQPLAIAGLRQLSRLGWLDTAPTGLEEYLAGLAPALPAERVLEVAPGATVVLREMPRIVLRTFAVRHPRPLMWVPTPFEAAFPPVLGYEISYDDHGRWLQVLLVGETAFDAGVLHRIWSGGASLTSAFLPIDLPMGGPLLETWYAHTCHAAPEFLALAARLASPRTTVVPIHQGLWCYDFNPADVPTLGRGRSGLPPLPQALSDALLAVQAHAGFGPARLRAWRRLTDLVAALAPQAVIADPTPGAPFALDRSRTMGRSLPAAPRDTWTPRPAQPVATPA